MKRLSAILVLTIYGMAQQPPPNDVRITAERLNAACRKVRARYAPCYPTLAIPRPKACSKEIDIMQKMLPVMEEVAAIAAAHQAGLLFFNTESARDFVETVEGWQ